MNNNILTPKKTEKFFEENVKFQKPLSEIEIDKNILSIFNEDIIKKYIVLPYKLENNVLTVITSINNMNKQRDISLSIKKILSINNKNWNVTIKYTDNNSELKRIITQNTQYTFSTITNNDKEINIDMSATRQKVLNMINVAIDRDVSDIHILPNINGIIVAFRVNGSLKDVSDEFKFTLDQRKQIANIAKNLDESGQARTSSDLVPSRGSFEVKHNGINVNIRISTVPTAAGYEKINFRLLVKRNNKRKITDLGYAKEDIDIIRLANKITTNGLFITAGPTGSGKSTMIFSVLYDEVDRAMLNYNELKKIVAKRNNDIKSRSYIINEVTKNLLFDEVESDNDHKYNLFRAKMFLKEFSSFINIQIQDDYLAHLIINQKSDTSNKKKTLHKNYEFVN